MSSSTFEVRESESDSEKVHDFGLDTCEENGIMSTQIDGELPKDHTYTKEPDVVQEDGMRDSDHSSDQAENMDGSPSPAKKSKAKVPGKNPPKKTAAGKTPKKSIGRGRTKKNSVVKILLSDVSPSKKVKKDDEEINTIEDNKGNGEVEDPPTEASNSNEVESKPAKRGKKRKTEEKENEQSEEAQSPTTDSSSSNVERSPRKKTATTRAKSTEDKPATKAKSVSTSDGEIDNDNLPKGWLRKKVVRKTGKTAGHIDVYIYSPDGFKLRSKPDIAAYLARTNSSLKLEDFGFTPGKITKKSSLINSPISKSPKKKSVTAKPKTPVKKKPSTPKKSPKLLVKIVSAKPKKSRAAKESPEKEEKESKSDAKGKGKTANVKGNKKKKNV